MCFQTLDFSVLLRFRGGSSPSESTSLCLLLSNREFSMSHFDFLRAHRSLNRNVSIKFDLTAFDLLFRDCTMCIHHFISTSTVVAYAPDDPTVGCGSRYGAILDTPQLVGVTDRDGDSHSRLGSSGYYEHDIPFTVG